MINHEAAIDIIRKVLQEVRPKLLASFGDIESTNKADGSSVTELDVYVEELLKSELTKIDPSYNFYGEETDHTELTDNTWIIDPIDGTDYFIRALPYCANLVALREEGEITLGIVYNFVTDEFFHAIRGTGAYMNGERIQIKERPINKTMLLYESKHDAQDGYKYLNSLYNAISADGIVHHYISGYQLAQLASGKLDGILCREPWENVWDVAAGNLLVHEAGGVVVNIGKDNYDVQDLNFIAATPILYDKLKAESLV